MHRIRLIEKRGVAPLTENERAEVAAGVTSYPEGKDVVLSGGADAAIRYYHGGQGGSLPLKEVGELLDDFFASIKDDWALAEIVTIGTPHWSESLEGDIFPVKLRNKPMMYWVMYTDGYGRNVSRSTYSHAGSAEEAASPKGDASPKGAVSLRAKKWAKKALAEYRANAARYADGYEIEDLMDTLDIASDELDTYEAELDYVVAELAKAGFEML